MRLEISRYGKKNHNQSTSLSATSCDSIEKKSQQPVEYTCGNQLVLEIGFYNQIENINKVLGSNKFFCHLRIVVWQYKNR